ncbi:hypothetical protein DSO57_1036529 [Entomophthora muscae]|uniref:Uncharacterized protein n=1 Tax=Entomophthora muscae TaxID=34485 RepID=A0ACC2TA93_9FUNG|nr:hypothetical protein DSO57_1036529 [Entomophthora muscae]
MALGQKDNQEQLEVPEVVNGQSGLTNQLVMSFTTITNEIMEEIVSLKQSGINFAKVATQLHFTNAVIQQELRALLKRGGTKLAKKPKKQQDSQIKDVYPIMLGLLQCDPYLQLTEVSFLLGLQGIYIASCTSQLWMHGLVVSVLILIN